MFKNKKLLKYAGLITGTLFFMVIVYYGEKTSEWFRATLLEPPQPFNGTTYPVQKVPDWNKFLVTGSAMPTYQKIPENQLIDLPPYTLSDLRYPDSKLLWKDPESDRIRNSKITYAVVYMAAYNNNHEEYSGSHLAVDLKLPEGTPIYAIANGRVIKSTVQESGFGHHIVVRHPDTPDPDYPGQTAVLYSVYAHMSDVNVVEGQNVKKGDMIGRSGKTGTATTPHLHFQIDRDSAPWHPYWPFTWNEAQKAGLSFFDAVSAGLGKDNAERNTIDPFPYLDKYLKSVYSGIASTEEVPSETTVAPQGVTPEPAAPESSPIASPSSVVEAANPLDLSVFKITGEHFALLGSSINLYIEDEKDQVSQWKSDDTVDVQVEGDARVSNRHLKSSDFVNRVAQFTVRSETLGRSLITIGKSAYEVNFIEQANPVAGFKIEQDGHFVKGVPKELVIKAIDANGKPTPVYNFTGIIQLTAKQGSARFKPEALEFKDFKEGAASVFMTALTDETIVVRAQNGALIGESNPLFSENGNLFVDISATNPYFKSIKFLKENGIVGGYADGSFRPNQTVNRAEALKMLMLAFNIEAQKGASLNFKDTNNNDWYASFLATALQKNIVGGYADGTFRPSQIVTRAEYLKILFKTNNMDSAPPEVKPYEDVPTDSWFASYAFLANKKNVMPLTEGEDHNPRLEPAKGMTRAEVAETIYRMKMIELNNWVTYSGD